MLMDREAGCRTGATSAKSGGGRLGGTAPARARPHNHARLPGYGFLGAALVSEPPALGHAEDLVLGVWPCLHRPLCCALCRKVCATCSTSPAEPSCNHEQKCGRMCVLRLDLPAPENCCVHRSTPCACLWALLSCTAHSLLMHGLPIHSLPPANSIDPPGQDTPLCRFACLCLQPRVMCCRFVSSCRGCIRSPYPLTQRLRVHPVS